MGRQEDQPDPPPAGSHVRAGDGEGDAAETIARWAPLTRRLELKRPVGGGGMGNIFRATDLRLKRQVAIKVIGDRGATQPDLLARFLLEARVVAQLEHPNIIPCYSLEATEGGRPALVMKLVQGKTFTDYMLACRGEPDAEAYSLCSRLEQLLKVCDAMAYAHKRGVLHRDLKPDNLMLGEHGQVYVMDWGLAKVKGQQEPANPSRPLPVEVGAEQGMTTTGDMIGTLGYMSPEQARGDNDILGPESDLFALGLLLQELITLERARPQGALADQLAFARSGMRRPPRTRSGDLAPAGLVAVLERACDPEPAARYGDVEEFAADIRRFIRGDAPSVLPDSHSMRLWKRLSSHRVGAMASVLALVTLAGVVTTASLWRVVNQEREAARRTARITRVVSSIAHTAQGIDVEMAQLGGRLETLAERLRSATDAVRATTPVLRSPEYFHGADATDARTRVRYGHAVSFKEAVSLLPASLGQAEREQARVQLGAMQSALPLAMLHAAGATKPLGPEGRVRFLLAGGSPLFWVFAGLQSGAHVSYPGSALIPWDFDPRVRPWYRVATEAGGAQWGMPYRDASTGRIMLPCSQAVRDDHGVLLGVVGADIHIQEAVDRVRMDRYRGWRRSWVVDAHGSVIVDTGGEQPRTDAAEVVGPLLPLPSARVRQALQSGDSGGHHVDGDALLVYQHLEAVAWYLVVELTAQSYLE